MTSSSPLQIRPDKGDQQKVDDFISGSAVKASSPASNPSSPTKKPVQTKPLQVTVPWYDKRDFKNHATNTGVTMNDLFLDMWELYKRHHSIKTDNPESI